MWCKFPAQEQVATSAKLRGRLLPHQRYRAASTPTRVKISATKYVLEWTMYTSFRHCEDFYYSAIGQPATGCEATQSTATRAPTHAWRARRTVVFRGTGRRASFACVTSRSALGGAGHGVGAGAACAGGRLYKRRRRSSTRSLVRWPLPVAPAAALAPPAAPSPTRALCSAPAGVCGQCL